MLTITGYDHIQGPVLEVKNRTQYGPAKYFIHGQPLRRCMSIICDIVANVRDKDGFPLGLQHHLDDRNFQGNLVLDGEAEAKLALIFTLQQGISDMDRVELIARNVAKFSREEAEYWLGRTRDYGKDANRWGRAGLRIMLGGQPGDSEVREALERWR